MMTRSLVCITLGLIMATQAACSTTQTYQGRATTSFTNHGSSPVYVAKSLPGGEAMAASAKFQRFEKGYEMTIALSHTKKEWVALEGWRMWLEDASGNRISPIESSEMGPEDARGPTMTVRGKQFVGWPGRSDLGSVVQHESGVDNQRHNTGPRFRNTTTTHTKKRTYNLVRAAFLAPQLAARPPGELTLIMQRGDEVLRFTWKITE